MSPLFSFSYTSLLSQYASVCYGDPLFACFILLPLQQRFSVQLRRVLWEEYPTVIRVLSLPLAQVGSYRLSHAKNRSENVVFEIFDQVN